jgi:hypothetical protein
MINISQILTEAATYTEYETIVYAKWTEEATMKYIEQRLRAEDSVTVVSDKLDYEGKKGKNSSYLKVKVLTTLPPEQAYNNLKKLALKNIAELTEFKYAKNMIKQIHS